MAKTFERFCSKHAIVVTNVAQLQLTLCGRANEKWEKRCGVVSTAVEEFKVSKNEGKTNYNDPPGKDPKQ